MARLLRMAHRMSVAARIRGLRAAGIRAVPQEVPNPPERGLLDRLAVPQSVRGHDHAVVDLVNGIPTRQRVVIHGSDPRDGRCPPGCRIGVPNPGINAPWPRPEHGVAVFAELDKSLHTPGF